MNKLAEFARESAAARILIPSGIILIVFGIFMTFFATYTRYYIEADAVVTRAELYEEADPKDNQEATYTVYVKYTVDGKEYEEEYGIFPGYKEGDTVRICYNPENAAEIAQPGNNKLMGSAIIAAGLIALILGIRSIVNAVKRQKALKEQEKEWSYGK